jgi:hypothetical protein
MSAYNYDGRCAKCKKGPVALGMVMFKDLAADGNGKSGAETEVWCVDCVINRLHQDFG